QPNRSLPAQARPIPTPCRAIPGIERRSRLATADCPATASREHNTTTPKPIQQTRTAENATALAGLTKDISILRLGSRGALHDGLRHAGHKLRRPKPAAPQRCETVITVCHRRAPNTNQRRQTLVCTALSMSGNRECCKSPLPLWRLPP